MTPGKGLSYKVYKGIFSGTQYGTEKKYLQTSMDIDILHLNKKPFVNNITTKMAGVGYHFNKNIP